MWSIVYGELENGPLRVEGFTDSEWAGRYKRSTIGYLNFLGDNLVNLKSKKQTIARSLVENTELWLIRRVSVCGFDIY